MPKPEIRAELLVETEFPEWNRLVTDSPNGSVYARPEYLDALCTAGGGQYRILAVRQGDTMLGGIGLYERDTRMGRLISPRLLLYYNGPVVGQHDGKYPSEQTARTIKILATLEAALRGRSYGSMVLKPRPGLLDLRAFIAAGWQAHPGFTYVVGISDLTKTRSLIEQNLRRLIDRCGHEGFTVTADDDFGGFFQLHSGTMQRVGSQVYLPESAFRSYYEALAHQGLIQLFHARRPSGEVIASQLVLLGHSVTHTVVAGADPEYLKSGVTAFLRWNVFARLAALGHTANDLTDASLNPVTHFKSQLGGALEPWLEVHSPQSARFRLGLRTAGVVAQSRRLAGTVVRRVMKGRGGTDE